MPLETGEIKSIGLSTGLIVANIGLMWVFLFTPLREINSFVFDFLIIGMLFYGALLTVGNWLGKRGVRQADYGMAILGVLILEFAYAMFGAGVLYLLGTTDSSLIMTVLGITFGVTLGITLIAAFAVYWTDRDFSRFRTYSAYAFLAALGAGFVGSFSGVFALFTFFLVLLGFLLDLVYEIWHMKQKPRNVYLNSIGIYVAFMGVFVEILRLVVEYYLRSEIE